MKAGRRMYLRMAVFNAVLMLDSMGSLLIRGEITHQGSTAAPLFGFVVNLVFFVWAVGGLVDE